MTDKIDITGGADQLIIARVDYQEAGIKAGDILMIKHRGPQDTEVVLALIDGKATVGRHPVKDASKTLGVVERLVRTLS